MQRYAGGVLMCVTHCWSGVRIGKSSLDLRRMNRRLPKSWRLGEMSRASSRSIPFTTEVTPNRLPTSEIMTFSLRIAATNTGLVSQRHAYPSIYHEQGLDTLKVVLHQPAVMLHAMIACISPIAAVEENAIRSAMQQRLLMVRR
jgi:hypothetical protein